MDKAKVFSSSSPMVWGWGSFPHFTSIFFLFSELDDNFSFVEFPPRSTSLSVRRREKKVGGKKYQVTLATRSHPRHHGPHCQSSLLSPLGPFEAGDSTRSPKATFSLTRCISSSISGFVPFLFRFRWFPSFFFEEVGGLGKIADSSLQDELYEVGAGTGGKDRRHFPYLALDPAILSPFRATKTHGSQEAPGSAICSHFSARFISPLRDP